LIFIDPDTGIKEKGATEKHLTFSELNHFYELLDNKSILMVYQHYQHRKPPAPDEPKRKFNEVSTLTGATPIIIADNSVMFLFLTKNPDLYESLTRILRNYARVEQTAARNKNSERSIDVIVSA
jgi:hypothetical protein